MVIVIAAAEGRVKFVLAGARAPPEQLVRHDHGGGVCRAGRRVAPQYGRERRDVTRSTRGTGRAAAARHSYNITGPPSPLAAAAAAAATTATQLCVGVVPRPPPTDGRAGEAGAAAERKGKRKKKTHTKRAPHILQFAFCPSAGHKCYRVRRDRHPRTNRGPTTTSLARALRDHPRPTPTTVYARRPSACVCVCVIDSIICPSLISRVCRVCVRLLLPPFFAYYY